MMSEAARFRMNMFCTVCKWEKSITVMNSLNRAYVMQQAISGEIDTIIIHV